MWDKITQGEVWQGEMSNKKKNGETYWEETHVAPILNEQGSIDHYVSVKLDITEKKACIGGLTRK